MNKKKVSALVLAGLITAQTLVPAMVTFADEVEKINVGNGQLQDNQDNQEQNQELEKYENTQEGDNSEVDNFKTKDSRTVVEGRNTYVNIPDQNLKREINAKLGKNNLDSEVSITEMESISSLEIEGKNIKSLDGLQYAKNLLQINASNNNISDITPLSGLSKLRYVYLNDNRISDISSLNNLSMLIKLVLRSNNINNIGQLSRFPQLQEVDLSNNNINNLSEFCNVNNLKYIYLNDNKISDISKLSALPNLQTLELKNNNITDISKLSDFVNLTSLNLSNNSISDISKLSSLIKLKNIVLDNNNISDISSLSVFNVTSVYMSVMDQTIKGDDTLSETVNNIVKDRSGNFVEPKSSDDYSYSDGKIKFKDISNSTLSYSFLKEEFVGQGGVITAKLRFSGIVTHNVGNISSVITAEVNQNNGGMTVSTTGLGLRIFTTLNNVNPNEVATYYITTARNESETPKFEIKATVLNKDYSKIKTNIGFDELDKLDNNVNTKLYIKRVVKGQKTAYIELKASDDYLTDAFNISNNKNISVSATKNEQNVIQLNKSIISNNLFISSKLSEVKVTTDKETGIRQFSVVGNVDVEGTYKIDSNIKYTIVAKKENEIVFKQLATKINNQGSYNGFKANLSLSKLKEVNLNTNEKISLELEIEYLGQVVKTMPINLSSEQSVVSITDKESKKIFEIKSEDGKAVIKKK